MCEIVAGPEGKKGEEYRKEGVVGPKLDIL